MEAVHHRDTKAQRKEGKWACIVGSLDFEESGILVFEAYFFEP